MGPVRAALGTVVPVAAGPRARGGLAAGTGEIPGAPGGETFGAAPLVDPFHFAEPAAVRVGRSGQEIVPPDAYGTLRRGQQTGVRDEGRQRTTLGGGTGVLPVVILGTEVEMPGTSGLDRRRRLVHGYAEVTSRTWRTPRWGGTPPCRSLAPVRIPGYGGGQRSAAHGSPLEFESSHEETAHEVWVDLP